MAEIYTRETSVIKFKLYWGGEITDADGTVTATVREYLPSGELVVPGTTYTATKLETDMGTYQITIPYTTAIVPKKLRVIWAYTVNQIPASNTQIVNVVKPYVSLAEVIKDLGIGTDPSDPMYKSYDELVMAERFARKVIENYTGQRFYLYDGTESVYGSGSDVLPLSFKIHSIDKLYGNDVNLIDNINEENNWVFNPIISETGFGLRVDRTNALDNITYSANGLIPPSINDSYYGAFQKDVKYRVEGKFGWQEVPDNVEQAAIQLVEDYFSKDRVWTNKYLKNIKTFDWQFEYASDAYRGTGNAYADQLLYPYVISSMVVI